jgi:hypothetical protein
MTVEIVLPIMRQRLGAMVIDQLIPQTHPLDKLTVIDQRGNFEYSKDTPFLLQILRPGRNIGTNAAWNYMWLTDCDFVGIIGDDYSFGPHLIDLLIESFSVNPSIGATTATIFKKRPAPPADLGRELSVREVAGKGHCGATIFKTNILKTVPKIPKEFFIFYGDNWLGYWLKVSGYGIFETNAAIGHKFREDLKHELDYIKIRRSEASIWLSWISGRRLLSGKLVDKGKL